MINEERTWLPGNRTASIGRKSLSCICLLMRDQSQVFTYTGVVRLDLEQLLCIGSVHKRVEGDAKKKKSAGPLPCLFVGMTISVCK